MTKISTRYFPFENRSLKITSSFDKNNKRTIISECKNCGKMDARNVFINLCDVCFKELGYKTCSCCGGDFNFDKEGSVSNYGDPICDKCI